MWIEDTVICDGCGTEVTLYTDGRSAYALTGAAGYGAMGIEADTQGDDIWRDGQSTIVACPAYERDDSGNRCRTEVVFTGEGITPQLQGEFWHPEEWAHPILEEAP